MEPTNQFIPAPEAEEKAIDLLPYLRELSARWRLIVASIVVAAIATALVDSFVVTKTYSAAAVLRPITTTAVEHRIEGFVGGLGGSGDLGGLASSLGGNSTDADEYLAIINGFGFNTALVERHPLPPKMLEVSWLDRIEDKFWTTDPRWRTYRMLQKRFDSAFGRETGNMTISFVAESPKEAEQILGYYIDDLRDLLRAREIVDASAAIESLRAEAAATADPMLRSELYSLEAKQVERKKMAQVEADFAFRVLDAPAASDRPYRPVVILDAAVAGILAAFAAAAFILLRGRPVREEGRSRAPQEPVGINPRKIGAA